MLLNGWGAGGNPFSFQSPAATATKGRRADGLDTDVVICGTGIAGLALAADLERRGVDYLVVEKASSPREGGTAIGFWTNAWRCLDNLGISEPLRKVLMWCRYKSIDPYHPTAQPHKPPTNPPTHAQLYWQGERVRIGTAGGGARELANFGVADCDYGPHEFRYVMRSELLRLLLKAVPAKVRGKMNGILDKGTPVRGA